MLCKNSPLPSSPVGSEISVGSPSPPPTVTRFSKHINAIPIDDRKTYDDPYTIPTKKLKLNNDYENAATANQSQKSKSITPPLLLPPKLPISTEANSVDRSNAEKVKSFSIADILGNHETNLRNEAAHQQLKNHLQQQQQQQKHHPFNLVTTKIVRPWDHFHGPIPVRPFLPSALYHYEQRLALDYQRQLQEHLNAQAELLRQRMSLDVIQSEDGSERSSSAASDCCSPSDSFNRLSADSGHHSHNQQSNINGIGGGGGSSTTTTASEQNNSKTNQKTKPNGTPLDALFQLTNKNFDEEEDQSHIDLFSTKQQPKKKRKSRTAFTNHQIFELEKRFLYQKYLSPADRDEIALGLGLSNAQVITWFQNRRAKLKRDMEELKKDVESVKALSAHKSFLENVNDLSILKKKPIHDQLNDDEDHHHHHHHHAHGHHITIAHHHHPPATIPTICNSQQIN